MTATVSGGIFVLVIFLTLLFEVLSATGRLVVAGTTIGGALALFMAGQQSFLRFRLSVSTVVMVIGLLGIAAGTNTPIGHFFDRQGLDTFLFLGVAFLSASVGFVFAFVQFVRYRSLQFILETAANLLVVKFVFFVGAQI